MRGGGDGHVTEPRRGGEAGGGGVPSSIPSHYGADAMPALVASMRRQRYELRKQTLIHVPTRQAKIPDPTKPRVRTPCRINHPSINHPYSPPKRMNEQMRMNVCAKKQSGTWCFASINFFSTEQLLLQ